MLEMETMVVDHTSPLPKFEGKTIVNETKVPHSCSTFTKMHPTNSWSTTPFHNITPLTKSILSISILPSNLEHPTITK